MFIKQLRFKIKNLLMKFWIHNIEVIVSMTSYPKRIDNIKPTLDSIFNQTVQPDKIFLWLAASEFKNKEDDLPQYLLDLVKKKKIYIKWCNNLKPHKKYFNALQEYQSSIVITVDDDLIFDNDLIECLLKSYIKYPNAISAMRTHLMKKDGHKFDKYKNFLLEQNLIINKPSMNILATNGAGTLFPPNIINFDYFSEELITKLGINCDDILLKLFEVVSDVPVVQPRKFKELKYVPNTQECSLWQINQLPDGNDKTLENIRVWSEKTFGKNFLISKIFDIPSENKKSKTVLYFAPHQDDELLTMGIDVANSIELGYNVHVILCANGSKSSVRKTLNNGKTCNFHNETHKYDLNIGDFVSARDREFVESCVSLGVPLSNIHIYPKRLADKELTVKTAENIICHYLNLFSSKNTRVCTIWHKNGKEQHIDHKTLGHAVYNLYKFYKLRDVRFFKETYCDSKTKFNEVKAPKSIEIKINNAIGAYSKWGPENGRYAIGYHSVRKEFDSLKKEKNIYYFDMK